MDNDVEMSPPVSVVADACSFEVTFLNQVLGEVCGRCDRAGWPTVEVILPMCIHFGDQSGLL